MKNDISKKDGKNTPPNSLQSSLQIKRNNDRSSEINVPLNVSYKGRLDYTISRCRLVSDLRGFCLYISQLSPFVSL